MKRWSPLAVLCLAAFPFAGQARPDASNVPEKLAGRWEVTEGANKGTVLELEKDGGLKLAVTAGELTINQEGRFKVTSGDTLEMTIKVGDRDQTEKIKYRFEKDDLVLTGPDNKAIKFVKKK